MSADGRKISVIINEYLDAHTKESLKRLYHVFNRYKPSTVKSCYYRWNKRRQTEQNAKRPNSVSKNHATNATLIKQTKSPVSLSKLDEVAYEQYLLHVANNSDPNINIAREIRNYLDQKKAIRIEKPQEDKTEEESDADFKAIMDGAKNYTRNLDIPGQT